LQKTTIGRNFIMNSVLTLSAILFPLITYPYASRVLGPANIGKVTFATSVVTYFGMVAQLGIPAYGIRACAKVRDNKEELSRTAQELLLLNLVMSVLAYAGLFLMIRLVPSIQSERSLYYVMSSLIILNTIGMNWLYQGVEEYSFIAAASAIAKLAALGLMFLTVKSQGDYVVYAALSVLAGSGACLLNLFHARKMISFRHFRTYNIRRHIKPVLVFFAMACATIIYTNLDTLMLGVMTDDAAVGYYNTSVKIKAALVAIVTSLGTVLMPRASYLLEHGSEKEFHRICRLSVTCVLFSSIPLAVFFMTFASPSVLVLSGRKFLPAVPAMIVITPTVPLIGLSNITGLDMLVPMGGEKKVLYSSIAGALTDLLLNALLIPKFGPAGAAAGTLAAEAAVLAVQVIALRQQGIGAMHEMLDGKDAGKVLLATVAALAMTFWIRQTAWNPLLQLPAAAVIFFGSYYAVLLVMRENAALMIRHKLLRRR
jgi:O-antigen/teichoic acid export membrane protein